MGLFSKAKDRLGRRDKSPAVRPKQDNVPASSAVPGPSAQPGSLPVSSAATVVVGRSSAAPDAAAGESVAHAAKVKADAHADERADEHADEHAGERADEHADESLWDRAYKALDPDMVADYDAVLAEVAKEQDATKDTGKKVVQELVDEASQRGKTAYEAKKLQYSVFNKTLVASKLVGDAVAVINRFKPIVDEAVKASAAASFAWVGVSLALGILANPQGVHEENLDGLAKVTSAMHYYTEIEPLLLRQKQDHGTASGVYRELEKLVVDLYTSILDFECRSALRFYCPRYRRVWKDMRRADDWKAMLSKIEASEAVLKDRSAQVLALIATDDQRAAAERAADILSDARLQLKAQTETLRAILNLEKKKELLEKVPLVPGALYSSYEDRATPQCQEDTRVATLEEINDWIQMPGARGVFWLSGPAGSGKSTISKTVAASLDGKGRLAASYFFRQPDRRMADKVFSTIARQLVENTPGFDVQLYETLETTNTPVSQLRHDLQCKKLITDPLAGLGSPRAPDAPKVVVVDGLDECDSDIEALCDLLCSLPDAVPGRLLVFIASRDVRSIADPIYARDDHTYTHLDLRRKTEESVSDIIAFVTTEFSKMAKKRRNNVVLADDETLSRVIALCTKPSPLFVFASTLCRSVSRNTSPSYQLNRWLNDRKNTAPESRLDELYASVIRQALFGDDNCTRYDESQRRDLLAIIGSLMSLSRPQPSASLAALLGMDPDHVNDMLDDFRPVLNIPDDDREPIQILHTSFVEFMRGHTVSDLQDFVANEDAMHSMLFQRCIAYMGENLKQDLCELGDPATSIADVNQSVLDAHIPAALQYACLFWSRHITRTDERALPTVLDFLKDHLLHWIEAMALLGKISDVASPLRELETWAMDELGQFIHDILAFHDAYGISIIKEFPLQVYGGALVWCPTSNMVRSTQWKHRLPVIESANSNMPNVELRPSPMEGHSGSICAVSFSPKLDILASCSYDGSVRIWNTKTRDCMDTVSVGKEPVNFVAYSPDGETLATASDCIRLWNSSDYELKRSIRLDREPLAIVFVPGSDDLIAHMSDGTVRAWDHKTGEAREHHGTTGTGVETWQRHLVVSPNGRFLTAYVLGTIFLFDTKTLSTLHKWHFGDIEFLAFAHDSQTVTAVNASSGLRTWSTTSYRKLSTLDIFDKPMDNCAISSDSQLLACERNSTVFIYAMDDIRAQAVHGREALENVKPLLVHNNRVDRDWGNMPSLFFSPDSRQLVVTDWYRITLLDVPRSRQIVADEEGWPFRDVQFSRDRRTFLTTQDRSVSVWDIADLQCRFATPCQSTCAGLSADGQCLAIYDDGLHQLLLYPQIQPEAAGSVGTGATDDAGGVDAPGLCLDVDHEVDLAADLVDDKVDLAADLLDHEVDLAALVDYDDNADTGCSMAFSADSQTLAVGFTNSIIRLWDVVAQKHTSTKQDAYYVSYASRTVVGLAFSEDSLMLAAGMWHRNDRNLVVLVYQVGKNGLGPTLQCVETDKAEGYMWEFWPGNRYLDIYTGLVDFEGGYIDFTDNRRRLPGTVHKVHRWLVRDGVRLLRLPNDLRSMNYYPGITDRIILPFVRGGFVVVTLVPSS